MSYRRNFANESIYHIFNRGVNKQEIFLDDNDYRRFCSNLNYFIETNTTQQLHKLSKKELNKIICSCPQNPKIEILSYCLMPNHFHLIIKQLTDNGITKFLGDVSNSYSRYFNIKYNRIGHLFQGRYKSIIVIDDNQLIHLSRYVHLNPCVAGITGDLFSYPWSSINDYIKNNKTRICNPKLVLGIFLNKIDQYRNFVSDYADYAKNLNDIKNISHD